MSRVIDFLFYDVSTYMFVALSCLYMTTTAPWTAYILVPGWMVVLGIILTRCIFEVVQRGWLRQAWEWIRFWSTEAWIKACLGIAHLHTSWFGRVFIAFGIINLALLGYWMYHNFHVLKFLRATVRLLTVAVQSLRNPPALMAEFRLWLDAMYIGWLLERGKLYVLTTLRGSEAGDGFQPFRVLFVTFSFAMAALLVYALRNIKPLQWCSYCMNALESFTPWSGSESVVSSPGSERRTRSSEKLTRSSPFLTEK